MAECPRAPAIRVPGEGIPESSFLRGLGECPSSLSWQHPGPSLPGAQGVLASAIQATARADGKPEEGAEQECVGLGK